MGRKVGIIAYGEPEDRRRVEVLARLAGTSVSQWLVTVIRQRYDSMLGPAAPLELDMRASPSDRME